MNTFNHLSQERKKKKVAQRWGVQLSNQFCPVSSYFLSNYHRLGTQEGARGLNSTEAMLVIQLMDFKWDDRHPYPSLQTIADRMAVSRRHLRDILKSLEEQGFVSRIPSTKGGTNRYDFSGLIAALEALNRQDVQEREAAA